MSHHVSFGDTPIVKPGLKAQITENQDLIQWLGPVVSREDEVQRERQSKIGG